MTAFFLRLTINAAMQHCHLMLRFVIHGLSIHGSQLAPLCIEGSVERNLPGDDSVHLTLQSLIAHTQLLAFLQHTVGSENSLRKLDS